MNKLEEIAAMFDDWLNTNQKELALTEVQTIWLLSEMALRRYKRYISGSVTTCIPEETLN